MGATSVTFLWADCDQMRSEGRGARVRVFSSDRKDKPAQSERCEIRASGQTGVRRGGTCLIPTKGRPRRLGRRLCFRHREMREGEREDEEQGGVVDSVSFKSSLLATSGYGPGHTAT